MNSIRLNLVFYEYILNHYRLMENIYWENFILQVKVRHIKNKKENPNKTEKFWENKIREKNLIK